jgi:putative salt-induced outer membrane protein YdiY
MELSAHPLILVLILMLIPGRGLPDTVFLKNGDRLSGSIIDKTADRLTLETGYAGRLEIQWADVSHLVTDNPVRVVLDDGTAVSGRLSATAGGELRIAAKPGAPAAPLSISRIAAINPPAAPGLSIKGQVNAGVDMDRGNTDNEAYHLDAESVFRWPGDRVTIGGKGDLEKSEGVKTKQQADLAGKYDHFMNEKWYLYGGLGFEHDGLADLDLRTIVSLGSGYQVFETERTNLSIEGGPAYIWENYDSSDDQDYVAAHWALRFDHRLYEAWNLQVFHKQSLDLRIRETSNYIFKTETGLRLPIIDRLQTTLQFNFDRNSAPAEDADKNDYEYLLTGGYTW